MRNIKGIEECLWKEVELRSIAKKLDEVPRHSKCEGCRGYNQEGCSEYINTEMIRDYYIGKARIK